MVSVIVPVYNEEKYLSECLQAILNQDYRSIELIVVDDGSKDRSTDIASKYTANLYIQSHSGPGRAKNLGAKKAEGEILVFVDADMVITRSFVSNIIKPIVQSNAVATFTRSEFVGNSDNVWSRYWNINNNLPIDRRLPKNYTPYDSAFRAIQKSYFIKRGGFNPRKGYEDDHFFANSSSQRAIAVDDAICYHKNPSSLMEVFVSAKWIGRNPKLKRNIRNLSKYSLFNSVRNAVTKIFSGANVGFLLFKVVFDFGVFLGIIFKNSKNNFSK